MGSYFSRHIIAVVRWIASRVPTTLGSGSDARTSTSGVISTMSNCQHRRSPILCAGPFAVTLFDQHFDRVDSWILGRSWTEIAKVAGFRAGRNVRPERFIVALISAIVCS